MKHTRKSFAFLLWMAFLFLSAACSGPQGTPVPAFTPDAAVVTGEFLIVYITSRDLSTNGELLEGMKRIQGLLNEKGWNIRLKLEYTATIDTGGLMAVDLIRNAVTAGTACDGYYVSTEDAAKLLGEKLICDLGALLPVEAPIFYERYQDFFHNGVPGLPTFIAGTKGMPAAFFVSKDAASAGLQVNTLGDVFSLLEKGDYAIKIGADLRGMYGIFDLWAAEKGFYPLSSYGMPGFIYARFSDKRCMPVPIERIEGFRDFTDRCRALIDSGRIIEVSDMQESDSEAVIGYLGPVLKLMNIYFLLNRHKTGEDYIAFPLADFASHALSRDRSSLKRLLVVPSTSDRANEIIKFMQWIVADQDNFDLVNCGERDKDYRIDGGRFEPLINGKPVTAKDWNKSYVFQSRPILFYDESMWRTTVYAASNYDAASATDLANAPPISEIEKNKAVPFEYSAVFEEIINDMAAIIEARKCLIYGLIDGDYADGRELSQRMPELLNMKDETDKLLGAYAERIQGLLEEQGRSVNN